MSADKTKSLLDKLIANSLREEELNELRELVKGSAEYQNIFDLHNALSGSDLSIDIPDAQAFAKMRSAVRQSILHRELYTEKNRISDLVNWIKSFFYRPEMAVAAITLLLGFFLGRLLPADSANQLSSKLVKYVSYMADENTRFVDSRNSPYQYSNINFKELSGQEVAMSFDVTTHLEMVRKKNDPVVREIIAQSLLNPTNPGTELKAIAYSENMMDKKIKDALIFAMLNAPALAVRQNAMSNLIKHEADNDITQAFMRVITEEKSIKMRLMALDYFEQNNIVSEEITAVLQDKDLKDSPAVWLKIKNYLSSGTQKGDQK